MIAGYRHAATAFLAFAARGYRVAVRAPDGLGLMLAASITTWIAFQALVNMATVTNTLPITGVPLPFFSYGGTSVAATLAAVGVLLNIAGQSRRTSSSRRFDATADRFERNSSRKLASVSARRPRS